MLVQSWPNAGPTLTNCWPNAGQMLAQCWPKCGPMLAQMRPTCGPNAAQMLPKSSYQLARTDQLNIEFVFALIYKVHMLMLAFRANSF